MDFEAIRQELQAFLQTYVTADARNNKVYGLLADMGRLEELIILLEGRSLIDEGLSALVEGLSPSRNPPLFKDD